MRPSTVRRRLMWAAVLAIVGGVAMPSVASAHTSFESSSPADGATFDSPVAQIDISFTNPASPSGDGFVVLDPGGQIRTPTSVTTADERLYTLTFDPPLEGGVVGVRWKVQAGDAHPIEGAFSFTVTTAGAAAATGSPVPAPVAASVDPAGADGMTDAEMAAMDTAAADTAATDMAGTDMGGMDMDMAGMDMDEFMAAETTSGESLATAGRVIGLIGVVLAIGVFAFLAIAMRGTAAEILFTSKVVRLLGVTAAVGAAIEYVGVTRLTDNSLTSAFSTSAGFASILRLTGGLAIAAGLAVILIPLRPRSAARTLSSAVLDEPRTVSRTDAVRPTGGLTRPAPRASVVPTAFRWRADSASSAAYVGIAAFVISFWFDGHTVSKGFRPLHMIFNSVHVVAGSVWAGGVITIAVLMYLRFRDGRPIRADELMLRFSPLATVSLVAVSAAGLIMSVFVLDSWSELTGTEWGQVLLLKIGAVAVAVGGGAYNHFVLIPALDAAPDDDDLIAQVRSIVTAEAIVLSFVVITTAWLVAAAS